MENIYDIIIIGAGPAGYTASIYASRYKLKNMIIGEIFGGYATQAHIVANFPSEESIEGSELAEKMHKHAENLRAEIIQGKVIDIKKNDNNFEVATDNNKTVIAKSIIIAIGTKHRKLGLKNETEFVGRGVSYCATCDAMFFKNKTVVVLGGSDSANKASLYLADIANHVYQIYRAKELRGDKQQIERVLENKKIDVIYETNIIKLLGEKKLEKIILDKEYNGSKELETNGLFIEIGSEPEYGLIEKLNLKTDELGFINVGKDQKTNIEGVFAAGDITNATGNFKQIITACSQGAVSANSAYNYIKSK
ncbi:MAG: FAD-dependent oxidoreductase [Patescibacteria group bacterium]|nr:FAD-dependent oxidoreductase [Patescibacteria group bacterium]